MCSSKSLTDSNVHGANMGPIWDRQDPAGPHVGPMNFAIWVVIKTGTAAVFPVSCTRLLHWNAVNHCTFLNNGDVNCRNISYKNHVISLHFTIWFPTYTSWISAIMSIWLLLSVCFCYLVAPVLTNRVCLLHLTITVGVVIAVLIMCLKWVDI